MANPFYVSPLGGLDVGGALGQAAAQREQRELNQQKMGMAERRLGLQEQQFEAEQQQQEQQQQLQQKSKELALRMQQGDLSAAQELYAINPQMGAQIDQALGVRDDKQAEQVGGWLEKYFSTPADKRNDFLQRTATQTPISVDDDLLAMDPAERDQYATMIAPRYLNKQQIDMLQGGTAQETTSQADFNYYQQLQQRDPEAAEQFGKAKGYIETGREAAPTTEQRNWKEYQRLKKTDPEAAKQYGQAAGFVSKEGRELSSHLQKRLSAYTDEASESAASRVKYSDLAQQFDEAGDIGAGFLEAGWGEKFKEFTGQSDWKTQLRKDMQQIKASEAIKNLPQGPATDKDIELVMKPFPPDTASAEYISSYLRGLAKLADYRERYNTFKANYVSDNGTERGMLNAWKEQGVEPETPQRKDIWEGASRLGKYEVVEVND